MHATRLLAVLLLSSATLHAQGSWSDEFDRPGLVGRAFAASTYQGDLVVGGKGVEADGRYFGFCARFDGARWQPLGKGIYSSSGNPYVFHHVSAFVEYQGDLIAGGFFTYAEGKSANSIARWDGAQWHALGSGVNGYVHEMAVYHGELYAVGEFTNAGGVTVKNIARWNGST